MAAHRQAFLAIGLLFAVGLIEFLPRSAVAASGMPAFLTEPGPFIEERGGVWALVKPQVKIVDGHGRAAESLIIFEDTSLQAVEARRDTLPNLRLSRELVTFNPLTRRRTLIEDWRGEADAEATEADVRALLNRFAAPETWKLYLSTPLYVARLNGALGHTAEQPDDFRRFAIYVDPFRATGRLHAASTIVHELAHVERYRRRGFHANRSAAILPKEDFILLGVSDELAAYQAEAELIHAFLRTIPDAEVHRVVREAMPSPELRWPAALIMLLGFEGPEDPQARMREARSRVVEDLQRQASRYWSVRHRSPLESDLKSAIRGWYERSSEWKEIAAQRQDWLDAGAHVWPPRAADNGR